MSLVYQFPGYDYEYNQARATSQVNGWRRNGRVIEDTVARRFLSKFATPNSAFLDIIRRAEVDMDLVMFQTANLIKQQRVGSKEQYELLALMAWILKRYTIEAEKMELRRIKAARG